MITHNGIPTLNSVRELAFENQKAQQAQIEHVAARLLQRVQSSAKSGHMDTCVPVSSLIPKRQQSMRYCVSWWRAVRQVMLRYEACGFKVRFSEGQVDPKTDAFVISPCPDSPSISTGVVLISWEKNP